MVGWGPVEDAAYLGGLIGDLMGGGAMNNVFHLLIFKKRDQECLKVVVMSLFGGT